MYSKLKKYFYFFFATYFKFFAKIQLKIWKPHIIVVTGSNGKTTLLYLVESQLKNEAKYSHLANSSYGIPFNILGLDRKSLTINEWPLLFLLTPFKAFKKPPNEKFYIVEADCDRPGEGKFLADLLRPEITLWISVSRTHSVNFDKLVEKSKFISVEEAIAHEFGYFLESTEKLSIVNGDSELIKGQLSRTKFPIKKVFKQELQDYSVSLSGTKFKIKSKIYSFKVLLPEATFYALKMCLLLLQHLDQKEKSFSNFRLPPGRSSIFKGIKNTTIIDSTYNATPASMSEILYMFGKIPGSGKWAILGDMIELGDEERAEHEKLAQIIKMLKLSRVILAGPRLSTYTYPRLKSMKNTTVEKFEKPHDVLNYLKRSIKGNELLLFKGARFLEGVIEHLLASKGDVNKLPRREEIWQRRKRQWGL